MMGLSGVGEWHPLSRVPPSTVGPLSRLAGWEWALQRKDCYIFSSGLHSSYKG